MNRLLSILIFLWQKTTWSWAKTLPSFLTGLFSWSTLSMMYRTHPWLPVNPSVVVHDSPCHVNSQCLPVTLERVQIPKCGFQGPLLYGPWHWPEFNFPILLRDTLCKPDLYKVPTLHRAISAAHARGHTILRTRNASSLPLCPPILPNSLLLILWLVESPGLDRELTQQHLPTSRSETCLAASL